jgi:hypothetical protein
MEYWGVHGYLHLPSEHLYLHGDEIHYTTTPFQVNSSLDFLYTEQEFRGYLFGMNATAGYVEIELLEEGINFSDVFGQTLYYFSGLPNFALVDGGWRFIVYNYDYLSITVPRYYRYYVVYTTIDGEIINFEKFVSETDPFRFFGYT